MTKKKFSEITFLARSRGGYFMFRTLATASMLVERNPIVAGGVAVSFWRALRKRRLMMLP
jgi:hypothetical protein